MASKRAGSSKRSKAAKGPAKGSGKGSAGTDAAKPKKLSKAERQQDNIRRLAEAGLIAPDELTDKHRKAIGRLNEAECDALISARRKLGFEGTMHVPGPKAIF